MYRDALLGRKQVNTAIPQKVPIVPAAGGQKQPQPQQAAHSNSSSGRGAIGSTSSTDNWKRVGRRQPVSNWSGYAFVDATTGSVSLNAKNVKYEKTRSIHPVPLILDFSDSASPIRLVSFRVCPEVKTPPPPAENAEGPRIYRRRPAIPTAVPIKSSNLSFALDSTLQLSRSEKVDPKFLTFAKRDGTPVDSEMVFQDTYDTRGEEYRVKINFDSEEQRNHAVLDKLRLGDRIAREADEMPVGAKPKEVDDTAPKRKQVSPKFSKQTQAVRWYFTALLLTSSCHAVAGGLVPLLCNRLASLWIKMGTPVVALRWANEALKVAPFDFHGHLNRCQALLALGRVDETIVAANSALSMLEGSCGPIKRLLASAQSRAQPSKAIAAAPKPAWRLCDDVTALVFSFLEQSERDEVAPVCKSWAAISRKVSREELIQRQPEYLAAYKRAQKRLEVTSEGLMTFSSMKTSDLKWQTGLPIAFFEKSLESLDPRKLEWALFTWPHLKHAITENRSILGLCLQKLDVCSAEERTRVVEMLRVALAHGCNPNVRIGSKTHTWEEDGTKVTRQPRPLEKAIAQGHREVAELLVQHGAVPELLIRNLINEKKLETIELLVSISPELLSTKATARKLVRACVKSGWIEGLKFFINKCVLKRFSSIVDELIELALSRFKDIVAKGVSDELWVDASQLPFTIEALKLLFVARNCSGAPLPDDCKAMKMAKELDATLWTTPLQRLLRGAPVRNTFELYSVNINPSHNNKPEAVV